MITSCPRFLKECIMEKVEKYFQYLVDEIHTTIVATVDDDGMPVTAAIDMMDCDENSLYFLTAKGKSFYDRLTKRGYIALTGIKGENTMTSVAVSVRGKVREVGYDLIPKLFEKNPYMREIYPTEESRKALTAFQIYEGGGEWFDLSKKPIERASFTFGEAEQKSEGFSSPMPASDARPADRSVRRTVLISAIPPP